MAKSAFYKVDKDFQKESYLLIQRQTEKIMQSSYLKCKFTNNTYLR